MSEVIQMSKRDEARKLVSDAINAAMLKVAWTQPVDMALLAATAKLAKKVLVTHSSGG